MEYDQIHLRPKTTISDIASRDEIDTTSYLWDLRIPVPIIAAPMTDVINAQVAQQIYNAGGYAFLHRFCSVEQQIEDYKSCDPNIGCCVGLNDYDRIEQLSKIGCKYFCLDVAYAAHKRVEDFINKYAQLKFIVGNIASKQQFDYLEQFDNIIGIRCGIGPGAGCSTKDNTGVYASAADVLLDIDFGANEASVIADGGIRKAGDFCKAIALGANFAMIGSEFASCKDSAAQTQIDPSGRVYNLFSGSASFENQKNYKSTPKYIEGKTVRIPQKQIKIQDLIKQYAEGLRSSMSYFNARSIERFHNLSTWAFDTEQQLSYT